MNEFGISNDRFDCCLMLDNSLDKFFIIHDNLMTCFYREIQEHVKATSCIKSPVVDSNVIYFSVRKLMLLRGKINQIFNKKRIVCIKNSDSLDYENCSYDDVLPMTRELFNKIYPKYEVKVTRPLKPDDRTKFKVLTCNKEFIKCSAIRDQSCNESFRLLILPPSKAISTFIGLKDLLVNNDLFGTQTDELSIDLKSMKEPVKFKSAIIDHYNPKDLPKINRRNNSNNSISSNRSRRSFNESCGLRLAKKYSVINASHGKSPSLDNRQDESLDPGIEERFVARVRGGHRVQRPGDVLQGRVSHVVGVHRIYAMFKRDYEAGQRMAESLVALADEAYSFQVLSSDAGPAKALTPTTVSKRSRVPEIKTKNSPRRYAKGEMCAAFSTERELWFRVQVKAVQQVDEMDIRDEDSYYTMFSVDFGYTLDGVAHIHTLDLSPELAMVPSMAVHLALADCQWKTGHIESQEFQPYMIPIDCEVNIKITKVRSPGSYEAHIFLLDNDIDLFEMLQQGLPLVRSTETQTQTQVDSTTQIAEKMVKAEGDESQPIETIDQPDIVKNKSLLSQIVDPYGGGDSFFALRNNSSSSLCSLFEYASNSEDEVFDAAKKRSTNSMKTTLITMEEEEEEEAVACVKQNPSSDDGDNLATKVNSSSALCSMFNNASNAEEDVVFEANKEPSSKTTPVTMEEKKEEEEELEEAVACHKTDPMSNDDKSADVNSDNDLPLSCNVSTSGGNAPIEDVETGHAKAVTDAAINDALSDCSDDDDISLYCLALTSDEELLS